MAVDMRNLIKKTLATYPFAFAPVRELVHSRVPEMRVKYINTQCMLLHGCPKENHFRWRSVPERSG